LPNTASGGSCPEGRFVKSGEQLKVSFQDMAKETIAIPIPLADFAAAYDKIK
jgi:invasion protein IalB